ncbi:MAG: ABC transporter ATP-binding protein [Chloroflexota bacterium]
MTAQTRGEATDLAIQIEGMWKSYGAVQAVENISMHVPTGSVYGLIGPNGCGKTTVIKVLAGLESPDSGSVQIAGMDARTHAAEIRARVGYVPDAFGVYDGLTVNEYVCFYAASHGIRRLQRARLASDLLELVDLAGKRSQPVQNLSRGMKQRLGLARCLIHDPDVLLLDEPASGMDPLARSELLEILRDLSTLGKTVLISSHILPELTDMCTHIGMFRAGEPLLEGPVGEVISILGSVPQLRIRLAVDAQQGEAVALLMVNSTCQNAGIDSTGEVIAEFLGTEQELSALLLGLIEHGMQVTNFVAVNRALEHELLTASRGTGYA